MGMFVLPKPSLGLQAVRITKSQGAPWHPRPATKVPACPQRCYPLLFDIYAAISDGRAGYLSSDLLHPAAGRLQECQVKATPLQKCGPRGCSWRWLPWLCSQGRVSAGCSANRRAASQQGGVVAQKLLYQDHLCSVPSTEMRGSLLRRQGLPMG